MCIHSWFKIYEKPSLIGKHQENSKTESLRSLRRLAEAGICKRVTPAGGTCSCARRPSGRVRRVTEMLPPTVAHSYPDPPQITACGQAECKLGFSSETPHEFQGQIGLTVTRTAFRVGWCCLRCSQKWFAPDVLKHE